MLQEVDGQVGGYCQWDDVDFVQYCYVQCDIGDGYQGWFGDCVVGVQVVGVDCLLDCGVMFVDGFDYDLGLGKFVLDEMGDLFFFVGYGMGFWQQEEERYGSWVQWLCVLFGVILQCVLKVWVKCVWLEKLW